jgi:hypothetical protein
MEIEGGEIFGLSAVREFVDSDSNYYLIGELSGQGGLGVRRGSSNGSVSLLGYDHTVVNYPSLRSALGILLAPGL